MQTFDTVESTEKKIKKRHQLKPKSSGKKRSIFTEKKKFFAPAFPESMVKQFQKQKDKANLRSQYA